MRNSGRAVAAESEPGAGSPVLSHTIPCHRDHGQGTRRDKAIKQQLPTTHEEQTIVDFVL